MPSLRHTADTRGCHLARVVLANRDVVLERARFFRAFLREPFSTGSVTPSSQALARRMVEGLDIASARTVVEAGPGTGALTGALVAACGPAAAIVAVEINAAFVAGLARRHPRAEVVHDSVERLPDLLRERALPPADVVISGLPWAVLDEATQERLLAGIVAALRPGGRFATFGYVQCAALPAQRRFRRRLGRDFEFLGRSEVVWRNVWPAVVYRWRKTPAGPGKEDRT